MFLIGVCPKIFSIMHVHSEAIKRKIEIQIKKEQLQQFFIEDQIKQVTLLDIGS